VVEDALEETLRIDNYNDFPVHLDLRFRLAADFADIFLVRGFPPGRQREVVQPAVWGASGLRMAYKGTDGRLRETVVEFRPEPESVETNQATAEVAFRELLAPRDHRVLHVVIAADGRVDVPRGASRFAIVSREYDTWKRSPPTSRPITTLRHGA
jgi:glycogen debranching enzyme